MNMPITHRRPPFDAAHVKRHTAIAHGHLNAYNPHSPSLCVHFWRGPLLVSRPRFAAYHSNPSQPGGRAQKRSSVKTLGSKQDDKFLPEPSLLEQGEAGIRACRPVRIGRLILGSLPAPMRPKPAGSLSSPGSESSLSSV